MRLLFSTLCLGLLAACNTTMPGQMLADMQGSISRQVNGLMAPASSADRQEISLQEDADKEYLRLTDTDLKAIFKNPYIDGKPETSWPRVALTVVNSPVNHDRTGFGVAPEYGLKGARDADSLTASHPPTNDDWRGSCYDLEAVKWENNVSSQKYTFRWCAENDMVYNIPFEDVWGRGTKTMWGFDYFGEVSTGKKRTVGPNPPDSVLPDDIKHRAYIVMSGLDTYMIGSIMYQMGFDWLDDKDRRFWVVKFTAVDNVPH